MAKCFITGVDLPIREAYVLDRAAAYRAVKDMREQLATLERLIEQLGPHDDTEIYDAGKRETVTRKDRRLVSPAVAQVLSAAHPKEALFIAWDEWRSRRPHVKGWTVTLETDDSTIQSDTVVPDQ